MIARRASNCGNVWSNDIVQDRELLDGASDTPACTWIGNPRRRTVRGIVSLELIIDHLLQFPMLAKGKTPTQRSLDSFGESVTTLATTRRPSFPTMMIEMMMTKKMNQARVPVTSQSTLDYQDYCVLRCLLGEAGYNPNDTHWNSRVKKGPDLLLQ
jgi:hypothetical protein